MRKRLIHTILPGLLSGLLVFVTRQAFPETSQVLWTVAAAGVGAALGLLINRIVFG